MSTAAAFAPDLERRSHALESITGALRAGSGLHVLDFGSTSQANIDYFTGLGHRLYAEDLLLSVESFFSPEELNAPALEPARIDQFLDSSLAFPDQSTDAALLWDTLQFIPPSLVPPLVDRLHRILSPEARMLVIFHPEKAGRTASPHKCRVVDGRTMQMVPRSMIRPLTPVQNRVIEKLFQRFTSVKFFLTRDHHREILVQR